MKQTAPRKRKKKKKLISFSYQNSSQRTPLKFLNVHPGRALNVSRGRQIPFFTWQFPSAPLYSFYVQERARSPVRRRNVPSSHHFLHVLSGLFPFAVPGHWFRSCSAPLFTRRGNRDERERGWRRNRVSAEGPRFPLRWLEKKKEKEERECATVANKETGFLQPRSLDFWHSELKNRPSAFRFEMRRTKRRKGKRDGKRKKKKRRERKERRKTRVGGVRIERGSSRDSLLFLCRFPARIRGDSILIESRAGSNLAGRVD